MEEAKAKVAKRLLIKGMNSSFVVEVTGLPEPNVEAVKKQLDQGARFHSDN